MKNARSSGDLSVRFCNWTLVLFTLLLLVAYLVANHFAPGGRRLAKLAGSDPIAYFSVSHSLLFDQDFDLANEYKRVPPEDSDIHWDVVRKETGHPGSPFPIGYSILAMPFLGLGTLVDAAAGYPADGYGSFALLGYSLTNVLLSGAGLIALFAFLRNTASLWGSRVQHPNVWALFVTLAMFFGTTVGYYSFSQMSHAATFFAASLFIGRWWAVRDRLDVQSWAVLGLAAGLLSLARWQDVFYVAGVVLYDLSGGFRAIRERLVSRLAFGAVLTLCWIPQLWEWKFIYGKYLLIPQGGGMIRLPPRFTHLVLFSTRNGWISWTPVVLLGIAGLAFGAIRWPRLFTPWIAVIALEALLVGSLPFTWHGGQSFSARYMTSSIPLIALGLIALLYGTGRAARWTLAIVAALCTVFGFVFAIQYRMDLVPKQDRLTVSEYLTDKFRLNAVRRRKQAVNRAEDLIAAGSPESAVQALLAVQNDGPDRDVMSELAKAYRAEGKEREAQESRDQLASRNLDRLW